MFGLFYALFGLGAMAVDSINKDIQDSEAQKRSRQNGGQWAIGARHNYWNGQQARWSGCDTPTSHYVIKDKNGRIIKDYTQEEYDERERKDEQKFYNQIKETIEKGEYFFERYEDTFFFSDGDFKENTPAGFYEIDTMKRFHTMTDTDGKYYKIYDKKEYNPEYSITRKWYDYTPDYDNKIEISEYEWKRLGGEKNQIRNKDKILYDSPGQRYTHTIVTVPFDNKKIGRR